MGSGSTVQTRDTLPSTATGQSGNRVFGRWGTQFGFWIKDFVRSPYRRLGGVNCPQVLVIKMAFPGVIGYTRSTTRAWYAGPAILSQTDQYL